MIDVRYIFNLGFIILGIILLILFHKVVRKSILSIFGGTIELTELAGIVFMGLFIYMIIKEGNRLYEWHLYNELYIFFTAGAAMTGLGLKHVLDVVKDIRSSGTNSTTIETKIETKETIEDESESPK